MSMYKHYINNKPIIIIPSFFTAKECDTLLEEKLGLFNKANTHYPKYYRNNDRLEENDHALAKSCFKRLQALNIPELDEATRMNEKLRYCRYASDQQFSKHQDGVYYPNEKEASKYTFLLYLNDKMDFSGGNTQFFESKQDRSVSFEIEPKRGDLVLFDHTLWHSGSLVTEGEKFILRSDILVSAHSQADKHRGYVWCLEHGADNTLYSGGRDAVIRHWSADMHLLNSFQVHKRSVIDICQMDSNSYASSSRDMTIKCWNSKGEVTAAKKLDHMILCLQKCGDLLLAGNTKGEVLVFDQTLRQLQTIKMHSSWVWGVAHYEGFIYSTSDDGKICRSKLDGTFRNIYAHEVGLFSLNISPEGMLHCGMQNGKMIEIDLRHRVIRKDRVHFDLIRSIAYFKDGILSCGEDNAIYYNSAGIKQLIGTHNNFVQDLLVMDKTIYSAGYDGSIKIWQVQGLPEPDTMEGVYC